MSNAKQARNKPFSLDRYRAEVKGEPFVFWVDDDHSIKVPRPSGDQLLEAEEAMRGGTSRGAIEALCGPVADELLDVIGREDAYILKAVFRDMQEHFGLGE